MVGNWLGWALASGRQQIQTFFKKEIFFKIIYNTVLLMRNNYSSNFFFLF
jgi:hypothetical protein